MIVGLTGGIGSGKTTVAHIFEHLGVPVFEADEISKNIIDTDKSLQRQLRHLLGDSVVNEQGKIDRPLMASIIFGDKQLLAKTNALIHPAVGRNFKSWYLQQKAPYIIREAAILFESNTYKDCDKIVVVTAPDDLRIKRVMDRSQLSRKQVLERMENQWPQEQKVEMADYVISNDLEHSVIKQVLQIHEDIIRQTNPRS